MADMIFLFLNNQRWQYCGVEVLNSMDLGYNYNQIAQNIQILIRL